MVQGTRTRLLPIIILMFLQRTNQSRTRKQDGEGNGFLVFIISMAEIMQQLTLLDKTQQQEKVKRKGFQYLESFQG